MKILVALFSLQMLFANPLPSNVPGSKRDAKPDAATSLVKTFRWPNRTVSVIHHPYPVLSTSIVWVNDPGYVSLETISYDILGQRGTYTISGQQGALTLYGTPLQPNTEYTVYFGYKMKIKWDGAGYAVDVLCQPMECPW